MHSMSSSSSKIDCSSVDKVSVSSLNTIYLEDATRLYRIIAHSSEKIFLQRNLLYKKKKHKAKQANYLYKKSFLSNEIVMTEKCTKRNESPRKKETEHVYITKHDGIDIVIFGLADSTNNDIEDIEIEANVVKLNGCLTEKVPLDNVVVNCLGTFKVAQIKQSSSKKQTSSKNNCQNEGGGRVIHIPPSAFTPVNGHSSWYSWLILKCQWSRGEKCDHSLRRLGHRQSSKWPLSNSYVTKNAALPLCKSNDTLLFDGPMDIRLWSSDKNDVHLAQVVKNVFTSRHKSSPYKSAKAIDKTEFSTAPCLKANFCWRNVSKSNLANGDSPLKNGFSSHSCSTSSVSQNAKLSLSASNDSCSENLTKLRSLRKRKMTPAVCEYLSKEKRRSVSITPTKGSPMQKNVASSVPRSLFYNFHCHANTDDDVIVESTSNVNVSKFPRDNNVAQLCTPIENASRCPFCDCFAEDLYSLLKHLNLCHQCFIFNYRENNKSIKRHIIEVMLNHHQADQVDTNHRVALKSYSGVRKITLPLKNRHQLIFAFFSSYKFKKTLKERSLLEFKANDSLALTKRHQSHVCKRQYYKSQTCAPMLPGDVYADSEDDVAPEWLRVTRTKLLDDFTDVNEGEKKIMKMWNLHMMKHIFFGDCRIFSACCSFLNTHLDLLVTKGGCQNFLLHASNLYNSGLLSQKQILALTCRINEAKRIFR